MYSFCFLHCLLHAFIISLSPVCCVRKRKTKLFNKVDASLSFSLLSSSWNFFPFFFSKTFLRSYAIKQHLKEFPCVIITTTSNSDYGIVVKEEKKERKTYYLCLPGQISLFPSKGYIVYCQGFITFFKLLQQQQQKKLCLSGFSFWQK